MSHCPLILESYFLNYAYDEQTNFQSRFFITLPYPNQNIEELNIETIDFLTIFFEMHSSYTITSGKVILNAYSIYSDSHSYEDILKEIPDEPNILKIHDYKNYEELYSHINSDLSSLFIEYINEYLNFVRHEISRNPTHSIDLEDILQIEKLRIERFIQDITLSIQCIMRKDLNNEIFHGNYSNQKTFDTLISIVSNWNLYILSSQLNHTNLQFSKKTKI